MKKIIYFFLAAFVAVGCSYDLEMADTDRLECCDKSEVGISRNLRDYLNIVRKDSDQTKVAGGYTISPYIYKGDTIMYVVNYYSGGWELLSTDYRAPLVVVSSESGLFDINNTKFLDSAVRDYISLISEDLHRLKSSSFDGAIIDNSWKAVKLFNNDVDARRIRKSPKVANSQPGIEGEWVLLERIDPVIIQIDSPERLTTTSWTQFSPWNSYSPCYNNSNGHAVAGCGAVALAQYLYFLHYKNGNPASTIDCAVYDNERNEYLFSGNSTVVWDLMAKTSADDGEDYTAKFIGYVGASCKSKYGMNVGEGTSTSISNVERFLNSFGYEYYLDDIDYNYVLKQMRGGYPVMAFASCTETSCGGHAFIIDGYENTITQSTNIYGWVGKDIDGNDTNDYDDDGNIVGYAFTYEDIVTVDFTKYMMNWGYDAYSNSLKFSMSNWDVGSHFYNANRKILREAN